MPYEEEEDIFAAFYGEEEDKTVSIQEDVAERFNRAIRGYHGNAAGKTAVCIVRSQMRATTGRLSVISSREYLLEQMEMN